VRQLKKTILKAGTLLFLLFAFIAGGYLLAARLDITFHLPFISHQREADSKVVLSESREILRLATVEYLYKSVFPYDFIPEGTDFRKLFSSLFRNEKLTDEEQALIDLYRLCAEIGIDLNMEQYTFAVITTRVKGGFDLSQKGIGIEETDGERPGKHNVTITLPKPIITECVVEDETSDRYPYPDIQAGPATWKEITSIAQRAIRKRVIEEGILEEAQQRGKAYLELLFSQAGYDKISFRTYD